MKVLIVKIWQQGIYTVTPLKWSLVSSADIRAQWFLSELSRIILGNVINYKWKIITNHFQYNNSNHKTPLNVFECG